MEATEAEKVYRFLDYYALTASAGGCGFPSHEAARGSRRRGRPNSVGSPADLRPHEGLRTVDEGFAAVCWGRRKVVASRSETRGARQSTPLYSRLIFLKEGGEVEAPNYVVEKLA